MLPHALHAGWLCERNAQNTSAPSLPLTLRALTARGLEEAEEAEGAGACLTPVLTVDASEDLGSREGEHTAVCIICCAPCSGCVLHRAAVAMPPLGEPRTSVDPSVITLRAMEANSPPEVIS